MKKVAIIMLLVSLFCIGCSSDSGNNKVTVHKPEINDIEKISYEKVKKYVDSPRDDVTILDVRTVDEYKEEHIEGAINLPLDIIHNIDISKDNKIIVYCRSGRRSNLAAIELIGLGYEVYDMGGIEDWPYDLVD